MVEEGPFIGPAEIEQKFIAWAQQVSRERESVLLWPEECGSECALGALLHSERTGLLKALHRFGLDPTEFRWSPWGQEQVIIQRLRNSYLLRLSRSSQTLAYEISPSANATSRNGSTRSYQLPELFDEWASAMRSEDDAANYVHVEAPQKRHLIARLASFRVENIRGFADLQWTCQDETQKTLLIIGQNGTGKTTLLRCLALLLLPKQIASSLLISPYCRLLRQGQSEGQVSATFVTGGHEIAAHMTIRGHGDNEEIVSHWSDDSKDFPEVIRVYAYGIGRSYDAEGGPARDSTLQAVNSLFHYNQPLANPTNVLLRLQALDKMNVTTESRETLEQILKRSLRALLQLNENFEFELNPRDGLFVITGQGRLPLANWADGYRVSLMWILDLWNSALSLGDLNSRSNGLTSSPQGLLLLDEIEQHAHPKLQLRQILALEQALPNLFRVVTTHSPLVTLGVAPSSVLVLRQEGDRVVQVSPPDYRRYTIDEIYRDDHLFNTEPQTEESESNMKRWKELIEIPWEKRTHEIQAELDQLSSWFANI
jgi:energy-coupling factor transporter ATP-binding protein EcfA2